jgi:hypothetical protein
MAVGSKKGEFTFGNNARIVFIAGEDLSYEDRVTLQADGKTVLKDPDGEYQVFFPKSVENGKQVEVLEIIAKGGGGSTPSDNTIYNTDGTLTANRNVNQDGNILTIQGGIFEQSRVDGVFTRKIQNNTDVGGTNNSGVGFFQESNTHLSAIFAGDSTNNGGTPNEVILIVVNKDFLTNGFTDVAQVLASPGSLEIRGADAGGLAEITFNSTDGITLNTSGTMPSSGIRLLGNGLLNPGSTAILGIRPDGYVEVVSDVIPAFDRQTITLNVNTPTTISSSAVSDIHSIQVYDDNGELVTVSVTKNGNFNERILESSSFINNAIIEISGVK